MSIITNDFILVPSKELLPDYKISPFTTWDLGKNRNLPESNQCDYYFNDRFNTLNYIYTLNGRGALYQALAYFNLNENDCVTILTTSGNFYISSCVTKEIEKFCKWSRSIEKNTRVILVNHEFGFPYKNLSKLIELGIPIIEDCAYSFFSKDNDEMIGTVGDFLVFSFPKIFPIQIGGLLVSNISAELTKKDQFTNEGLRYVKSVLSYYINKKDEIIHDRIANYGFLKWKFESLGFTERFQLSTDLVPGVFMFKTNGQRLDLPELKKYFYAHGVQCSVFYGEEAFYIPVNQALKEQDLLFFYEVMKSFLNQTAS